MATSRLSKLKDKVAKKLPKLPKLNRSEKLAALGTVVSVGTAIYTLSQQNASSSNRSANTNGTLSINKDELINAIKSDTNLQNLLRGYSGANGANGANGAGGETGQKGDKGEKGDKGDKGEDSLSIVKIPISEIVEQVYPSLQIGQIGILPDFTLIRKIAEPIGNLGISEVEILGNIKGENGTNGTKIYYFETLADFEENVGFLQYQIDDLFLVVENGTLYKKTSNTIPPNATNQAYYTTVIVLKGENGLDGEMLRVDGGTNSSGYNYVRGIDPSNGTAYIKKLGNTGQLDDLLVTISRDQNKGVIRLWESGFSGLELSGDGVAKKIGGGSFTAISDERLKENIEDFSSGLNEILTIQTKSFNYKKVIGAETEFYPDFICKTKQYGLIAQQIHGVCPEMVIEGKDGYLSVNLSNLPLMLVNAVKELNKKIESLESRLSKLENPTV